MIIAKTRIEMKSEATKIFLSGGIIVSIAVLVKDILLYPSGIGIYFVYIVFGLFFYVLVEGLKKMPIRILAIFGIPGWVGSTWYFIALCSN